MENITQVSKGIFTDSSPRSQPKDTYRFGLNVVQESEEGDIQSLSNEESNEIYATLPKDYIPLGKVYIGEGSTLICLVHENNIFSEIGVLDENKNYVTYMNDMLSVNKLNFRKEHKIQLTYRLRRGCERTVYLVDGYNTPRYFNIDSPHLFKTNGLFDAEKFKLFKTFNQIPTFNNIKIVSGGVIPSGSYNAAIQYLDEDFNPTQWITTTDTVIIYTDSVEGKEFSEIRGSTNKKNEYQDYGLSGKAISFELGNLNESFPFYRIAIIAANSGTGEVSSVVYSPEQSIYNKTFVYTGENEGYTIGTVNEVSTFNTIIDKVDHIEQIENRLILANTSGKKINYCNLQKYASKITSKYVIKKINLESVDFANNQKRGEIHNEDLGYMPGEIYSFGIVYVFEDGSESPVNHIPGKSLTQVSNMAGNNILQNTQYIDNDSCGGGFWGKDAEGNDLKNKLVRHHRFPSRGEINEPLFKKSYYNPLEENPGEILPGTILLTITGTLPEDDLRTKIYYRIPYTKDGIDPIFIDGVIDIADYNSKLNDGINPDYDKIVLLTEQYSTIGRSVTSDIQERNEERVYTDVKTLNYTLDVRAGITPSVSEDVQYTSNILGISFENIDMPSMLDTLGEKIVGYYIVRNERKENNKTILDSGVLTPMMEELTKNGESKFVSHGHLAPDSNRLKQDVFALIHPEHKFNGLEYKNTTEYIKEGEYLFTETNYKGLYTEDVMPGTSYDSSANKRREKDSDGFTLNNRIRNTNLSYRSTTPEVLASDSEISDTFYLDTLYSKTITNTDNKRKSIYNLSADNKIGIAQFNKKLPTSHFNKKLPYVVMKRNLSDPYANFRNAAYYKEHVNLKKFTTRDGTNNKSGPIFNGDSYISSMKYISTMFYAIVMRKRAGKSGIFNFVLGVLAVIAGVLITVGTLGGGAAIGVAIISLGITQVATGLKKEQLARVYGDLYDQGLKDTVEDNHTSSVFKSGTQIPDDEIQWFQDSLSNLWFESSVNMNWRMGTTIGLPDFMNSPTGYDPNTYTNYALEKTTALDSEAGGGRTYQGYAKAEIYEINKDFTRRDREKRYYPLGIEYDCCSDCLEEFPQRVYYSEQSFQEELTDNYRVFLPNNYRDIEGETGKITNLFRIQNNLYIHTEEALWHLPQNFQERVTGDIVSFIGTGDYFSLPPRKIVDDQNGHSAGTKHKWGMIKTPYGVFFPSERQGSIYKFSGDNIESLSLDGNFNWFKNNMKIVSTDIDSGFLSVYDSRKERVIFTKKDVISKFHNNSWTMSYSLKSGSWASWHSYLPDFYITTPNRFYSWVKGSPSIWKHNVKGKYQNFYGKRQPFIIEYVGLSNALQTKVWDYITLLTEAHKYDEASGEFFERRFITFNKAVIYNERQCTGEMRLVVKDTQENPIDYLSQQIIAQSNNDVIIDKDEKNWHLNDIRDIRTDYEAPIWNSKVNKNYFMDKVLNNASLDVEKDWSQMESFRGKYLVVRLVFDTFDDVKLIFNASVENEDVSLR